MSKESENQAAAKLALQNAVLEIAVEVVKQLISHAPELFADFVKLISKKGVTVADIDAWIEQLKKDTYDSLIPESQIPAGESDAGNIGDGHVP